MGSPAQLGWALCGHRSRDGWALRSSDWSRWCRCRRVSRSAWSNLPTRWLAYLKFYFVRENFLFTKSQLQLTLIDNHEVGMTILVDLTNSAEQKSNASVLKWKIFVIKINLLNWFYSDNSVTHFIANHRNEFPFNCWMECHRLNII